MYITKVRNTVYTTLQYVVQTSLKDQVNCRRKVSFKADNMQYMIVF